MINCIYINNLFKSTYNRVGKLKNIDFPYNLWYSITTSCNWLHCEEKSMDILVSQIITSRIALWREIDGHIRLSVVKWELYYRVLFYLGGISWN